MTTTNTSNETPVLSQWMENATGADLIRWAEQADTELQQLRLVAAQLQEEVDRIEAMNRDTANAHAADMEDALNADRWQAEEWYSDAETRDAMLPELLSSPLYGANVHS